MCCSGEAQPSTVTFQLSELSTLPANSYSNILAYQTLVEVGAGALPACLPACLHGSDTLLPALPASPRSVLVGAVTPGKLHIISI
jgi:hypothetical protein